MASWRNIVSTRRWSHTKNASNSYNVRTATPVANAIGSTLLRFKSVMSPTMHRSQ